MADYNVIAPIVGSVAFGVAFLGVLIVGLFRSGSSVQQMRWILALTTLLVHAVAYGSISLRQPLVDRPEGVGIKPVLWALPTVWTITHPLVALIVGLGIFRAVGARVLPAAITLLASAPLALGIFLDGFDLWFWFIVGAVLYALLILAFLFVDRLDVLAAAVSRKAACSIDRSEPVAWPGLVWRLVFVAAVGVYYILWGLDRFAGAVFTSYTVPLVLYVILDVIVHIVFVFLNYYLVAPVEPDFTAPLNEFSGNAAAATAAQAASAEALKADSINGYAAGARQRHTGQANGYSILASNRQ